MKKIEVIFDAVRSLGLNPVIDTDGDIEFKNNFGTFYIYYDEEDGFFSLVFPSFYETDSLAKKNEALLACNEVNEKIKVVKLYIYKDDVFASAEAFYPGDQGVKNLIDKYLKATYAALKLFSENISAFGNAPEK
ncbi:hypothetical protein ACFOJE_14015 [Azotobacter bryophylli]|uniref:YbjN domain-containing protein n=1 Tax=Azotobacter bryophylli TaxID=1986537 RepID=A0ABV7AVR5_9GAMM